MASLESLVVFTSPIHTIWIKYYFYQHFFDVSFWWIYSFWFLNKNVVFEIMSICLSVCPYLESTINRLTLWHLVVRTVTQYLQEFIFEFLEVQILKNNFAPQNRWKNIADPNLSKSVVTTLIYILWILMLYVYNEMTPNTCLGKFQIIKGFKGSKAKCYLIVHKIIQFK